MIDIAHEVHQKEIRRFAYILLVSSPEAALPPSLRAPIKVRDTKYFKGLAERFKNGASASGRATSKTGLGVDCESSSTDHIEVHGRCHGAREDGQDSCGDFEAGVEEMAKEMASALRGGCATGSCVHLPCLSANVGIMNTALGAGAF